MAKKLSKKHELLTTLLEIAETQQEKGYVSMRKLRIIINGLWD